MDHPKCDRVYVFVAAFRLGSLTCVCISVIALRLSNLARVPGLAAVPPFFVGVAVIFALGLFFGLVLGLARFARSAILILAVSQVFEELVSGVLQLLSF